MSLETSSIIRAYADVIRRRPYFAWVLLIYAAGLIAFFTWIDTRKEREKEFVASEQIEMLKKTIANQQEMLVVLQKNRPERTFFKDLTFEEKWNDEKTRAEVLRLVDYAKYAEGKSDFAYAAKLYLDANKLQDTLTVTYYQGRNAYFSGDMNQTEQLWRKLLRLDSENHYPEIRFYLACVLYENGRERESKELLKDYIGK